MLEVSYSVESTENPKPKKLRDEEKRKEKHKQTSETKGANKQKHESETYDKVSNSKVYGTVWVGGVGRSGLGLMTEPCVASCVVLLWVSRKGAFFTKSGKVLKWKYYSYHYCFLLLVMPQFKGNNYILGGSGGVGGDGGSLGGVIQKTNSWNNSEDHSWVELPWSGFELNSDVITILFVLQGCKGIPVEWTLCFWFSDSDGHLAIAGFVLKAKLLRN